MRLNAYSSLKIYKERTKKYHDKKILERNFHIGQSVLLFNYRLILFPGKIISKWSCPNIYFINLLLNFFILIFLLIIVDKIYDFCINL